TIDTTNDQQVARDEALIPHAKRLRIGRSNFRLLSDIKSKESSLQLVYDVLRLTPFFKAFLVFADVLEIYMQEFWATATGYHHSIRFKMDNKKHIINLESFREIPFAAIINKCLTGKSSGYDSLRLSQAQILWGLYHKRNVDFAYLMWEDFVYQMEHKDTKKSNEMYYPRFEGYHPPLHGKGSFYSKEKQGELELEYYAVAIGATPPKPKASVRKTRSSSDTTITPPTTVAGLRLTTSKKGKQEAKASKAKSLSALSKQDDDDEAQDNKDQEDEGNNEDDEEEGSDDEQASDEEEFIHPSLSPHAEEETKDEESFDPIPKTLENSDDEGNCEENLGINVSREVAHDEEEEEDELYRDVNINQGRGIQTTQEFKDSHVTLTPFAGAVSSIPRIVQRYMDQRMNEAVKVAVQIQSDRLHDEAQADNDEFLKTIDENIQKIIKEQVKEQVMVQVFKILPKIKQTMNEQLEAEVLTRSSNSSKTSYAVAADLSEMELKKIIIKKIEGNKSIHRSNEKRNLYKALVEAYESDKIILDIYEDTVTLKRRRDDDADKDEEPSTGPDQGSKRRREGKDPESASAPKEKTTRSAELEFFLEEVYKATTDQLDWVNPEGASSRKYTTFVTKTKAAYYGHIKWIEDLVPRTMWIQEPIGYDKHALWGISHWGRKRQQFYGFAINRESARDVYSKRRIITVTELKIVEWHNYKHLDWIMVRRDDDKLYKFKEGDFKRLRIQDIEDMLLLLVQGKLTNLTIKECFAFNKKLNLTKPDTYRSDLKHKEAYIAYSNPRGFIYQNKDKQNRTLTDVRTALDDRLKGIQMKYLPQSIWRKSDKDRAIDKRLKTRRIMRSLERFVGGRLYEGDFRMLQRTI
nr:hypothetical protein [Tanacetum cinerariifolium]